MSSIRFIRSRSRLVVLCSGGRLMMSSSTSRMLSLFRFGCSNDISSSNLCSCCCCAVRSAYATYVFAPFSSCLRMPAYIPLPHAQEAPPCTGLPRMVRDSCLHAWSRTPSIPSILAAGVVYRARTVKPSHMSPPRGQSLPAATHSEAVSYSCNAALAVGISFLVGCNPKLVCPATLMLFSVGTVPASGGTPTL